MCCSFIYPHLRILGNFHKCLSTKHMSSVSTVNLGEGRGTLGPCQSIFISLSPHPYLFFKSLFFFPLILQVNGIALRTIYTFSIYPRGLIKSINNAPQGTINIQLTLFIEFRLDMPYNKHCTDLWVELMHKAFS